jgi:hypothetical protein
MRRWHGDRSPSETVDPAGLARQLLKAKRDDCTLLVDASLRPVIFLQDRPRGVLEDTLALALVSLAGLSEGQRKHVREQQEPSLFHLPVRPAKYGLAVEMAVDLNGLLRIGCGALLPRAVGNLDDNEMRVIGERLVAHLDIDLEPIIARQVEERLQQLTGPEML